MRAGGLAIWSWQKKRFFFFFRLARPHFSHIPSFMKQHAGASRVVLMPLGGGGRWSRVRPPPPPPASILYSGQKFLGKRQRELQKRTFPPLGSACGFAGWQPRGKGIQQKREGRLIQFAKKRRSLDFKGEKETCSSFTQLFRGKRERKPTTFAWESGRRG